MARPLSDRPEPEDPDPEPEPELELELEPELELPLLLLLLDPQAAMVNAEAITASEPSVKRNGRM
ncbi:hypothetical protein [Sinomonas sp.]|uniref:hypothetical protein n=1 Tax=Sinomonas sp. TaxID=1914986 RepID=UPI002FDF7A03